MEGFGGFGKSSGPSVPPPKGQTLFGNNPTPSSPSPITPFINQSQSQRLENGNEILFNNSDSEVVRKAHSSPLVGRNFPTHEPPGEAQRLLSKPSSNFQLLKNTRSQPVVYDDEYLWTPINSHHPQGDVDRSSVSPPTLGKPSSLIRNNASQIHQRSSQFSKEVDANRVRTKVLTSQAAKRDRSPPLPFTGGTFPQDENERWEMQAKAKRLARFSTELNQLVQSNDDIPKNKSSGNKHGLELMEKRNYSMKQPVAGAGDLMLSDNEGLEACNVITGLCPYMCPGHAKDRSWHAERRICHTGLGTTPPITVMASAETVTSMRAKLAEIGGVADNTQEHQYQQRRHLMCHPDYKGHLHLPMEHGTEDRVLSRDSGHPETVLRVIAGIGTSLIRGDTRTESEREERKRKGDLDKYERLDGDRNQTSISLAVKKYNRTAEREADLIRPMPVLQKTVEYLLALLDEPYDDRFLGMYNFLWDRMRAIRMDLRMQHIFNKDAIAMLEQMIRLHIIAMHELCEYTKGEGFSEGFDAHLNIEQMNKTSVELFQMYDDHRKKGSVIPSEKEFRGYYALLKLDKHPGYKVEPAELSLDLAKMAPEIRQTPEILFARDVARACRTSNFIAFFRLARKATYLQACLMHAHFSKLRAQALASLHSGLQNNQGIPVAQVTQWLGMEEDDIYSLLEYHGFVVKEFEEFFMVKDGSFLSSDKDYPTRCSQFVHLKKSRSIFEDVSFSHQLVLPAKEAKQVASDATIKVTPQTTRSAKRKTLANMADIDMFVFEEDLSATSVDGSLSQTMLEIPSKIEQKIENNRPLTETFFPSIPHSPQSIPCKIKRVSKQPRESHFETPQNDYLDWNLSSNLKGIPMHVTMSGKATEIKKSDGSYTESLAQMPELHITTKPHKIDEVLAGHQRVEVSKEAVISHQEVECVEDLTVQQKREATTAKLRLVLRIWKRLSSKQRMLREKRQLATKVALSLLSLGPPIRQVKAQRSSGSKLNIDLVVSERCERYIRSWSRLNVSEVVANILCERNPDANYLCWKLVVCSEINRTRGVLVQGEQSKHLVGPWLRYKLMGTLKENDEELAVSSPSLSIWKKWDTARYGIPSTCCLSVIMEMEMDKLNETVCGASAVLFLVSETISWDLQKNQLHKIVMSLPSGSCLPLLILSGKSKEDTVNPSLTVMNNLALHYLDKTRISNFRVTFLLESRPPEHIEGFFCNDLLLEGLQWLASQSPVQPILQCVKIHELVMDHLNSSLEVLETMDVYSVGPNHCISAFNEALDQSAAEVVKLGYSNPGSWPCPEINMLEKFSYERGVMESFLPSVGWSSSRTLKPIISAIQVCKLPSFPSNLSWWSHGLRMGEEIKNQISELERSLVWYLCDHSKIMDWAFAITEASVMLQKDAQLELQGSKYHIVPRWVAIFRRVFNWRLMNLTGGNLSEAYVLKSRSKRYRGRQFDTGATSSTQPSLNEMVEACCSQNLSGWEPMEPEAEVVQCIDARIESESTEDDDNFRQDGENRETDNAYGTSYVSSEVAFVTTTKRKQEADRLTQLLEHCSMLQDNIDDKLSIYF
ncbi:hypothetical protein GIB67_039516 [Kingdonia uniflora]|uniref:PCI domain-containing protein n=1 Tax=Kingdonia uniflora TaxID=39325 RepID=A0A7J7LJ32_9MAGN|nr:hypothetical protein GIB67_039516 [Kingdonia uniflora]